LAALSFQTHEILKGATSGLEDETWLFGAGADRRVRCNYTVAMQRSIPSMTAEAEFGSTIIPATLSGKPTSVVSAFISLLVLKDIIMIILTCQYSEYDTGKLFFSTLGSVCKISDCILRKLRGFLMVVSLDCTKLELLGEGIEKSLPNKSKEKLSACSRRKKGRNRNMKKVSPVLRSSLDDFLCNKSLKILCYSFTNSLSNFTYRHTLRIFSYDCSE
jgi:hypothetical protein